MTVSLSHAEILTRFTTGLGLEGQPWRIVMKALDGLTQLKEINLKGMSLMELHVCIGMM